MFLAPPPAPCPKFRDDIVLHIYRRTCAALTWDGAHEATAQIGRPSHGPKEVDPWLYF